VNLFLCVHEKDHERQVVVELEQIEIDVVNAREAHANKLIGDVFDLLKTDNLPVKYGAVKSRHATHDDHERLVGLGGQPLPWGQREKPAIFDSFGFAAAAFGPFLSVRRSAREQYQGRRQDRHAIHAKSPWIVRGTSAFGGLRGAQKISE